MSVARPVAEKVLARLRSARETAVPAAEFRDLGERAAVDQAPSRLTQQGAIRRVRRGSMNCHVSAGAAAARISTRRVA